MSNLTAEAKFFKEISKQVLDLVAGFADKPAVAKHKGRSGDYATELDVATEYLIVAEIKKRFPGDDILAEEGSSDTIIGENRIWIIDPICGTNNVGRGIRNFCTNIALAEGKQLIASCVVDHSCKDVVWSIGNSEVYINETLHKTSSHELGVTIDVDLGCLTKTSGETKSRHSRFIKEVSLQTDFMMLSLNSSLNFLYVAIGKLAGLAQPYVHAWDMCASVFLIQQMGGIVTDIEGKSWHIESSNVIAAQDKDVHDKLIKLYKQS